MTTKIFTLLESIVMAIQTGLSVYIGQNLGAGRILRVRKGQHQTVLSAMGLAVILNVIVQGTAPQLVSLFLSKSDPLYMQTLHVAVADVRVITLGIFIMAPMYLYRIAIQTLGHPQYPMYAGFLQLAARVFAVTVLPPLIGEYAYYLSTVLAWMVTLPVVVIPFSIGQLFKRIVDMRAHSNRLAQVHRRTRYGIQYARRNQSRIDRHIGVSSNHNLMV